MTRKMRSLVLTVVGAMSLLIVQVASATTDPVLDSQVDTIQSYFTDNIGVVIGLFITVAALLWMFALAVRSAGAQRRNKAG